MDFDLWALGFSLFGCELGVSSLSWKGPSLFGIVLLLEPSEDCLEVSVSFGLYIERAIEEDF